MPEAYIVDAVRTPIGRKDGALSKVHPSDLGALVLRSIVERSRLDPVLVDDVQGAPLDTHRLAPIGLV